MGKVFLSCIVMTIGREFFVLTANNQPDRQ